MTTPLSGAISLSQIRTELEGSGPISMSSLPCRLLSDKPSGPLKLSDFYGATLVKLTVGTWMGLPGQYWGYELGVGGAASKTVIKGVTFNILETPFGVGNQGYFPLGLGFAATKPVLTSVYLSGTKYILADSSPSVYSIGPGVGDIPAPGFVVGNVLPLYFK